jgi:transcription initiation factor TFIIIB Brf1 subunit/transcription initiation factor TFIIB
MDSDTEIDEESLWADFEQCCTVGKSLIPEKKKCKCGTPEHAFVVINGDITCTDCGRISEGSIISDSAEWNNYTEDGVMNGSGNRCGVTLDSTNPYDTPGEFIPRYMWSSHIDSSGVKRYTNLSKIAIRTSYSSKQRAFDEGKYSFERIQTVLSLSDAVFNTAKLFWGILLKTDILKRGGNRRGMKACCIFYACVSERQQRSREDISVAFDIHGTSDFTKGEKIFREIFEKNETYAWVLYKGCNNVTMYTRYISQLGLPFKTIKTMMLIKEHTGDYLLGIAAKSEIAGLLYYTVAFVMELKTPSKTEIAKCIGICAPTLNKVVETIKFFYTSKNPELFINLKK